MKRYAMIYRMGESIGVLTVQAVNFAEALQALFKRKPNAEFVSLTG